MHIRRLAAQVRDIYVLHPSGQVHHAVRRVVAMRGGRRMVAARDWAHLRELYENAAPTSLFLADAYVPGGARRELSDEVRRFMAGYPAAGLLAVIGEVDETSLPALRALSSWGVHDVVEMHDCLGQWTLDALLRINAERRVQRAPEGLLPLHAHPATRAFVSAVSAALAQSGDPGRIPALLRAGEDELRDFCARRGLPGLGRLLEWLRLVYASELLDEPARPVPSAARACGYADESELEAAALRLVGLPLADLRSAGAFRFVTAGFRNEMLALEAEARKRNGR